MGLFVRDNDYDESQRMTGFNRYKQLLSFYGTHYVKLNIITFVSALPLIIGIGYSILTTSLIFAIVFGLLGGAILGPFIAALVDTMYRGMRDDAGLRWDNYKKGLRQNIWCSLFPGAILGLFISIYCFIFFLYFYANAISFSGVSLFALAVALVLFVIFEDLLWPQLVLFNQPLSQTLINIILFSSKYLWKMLKIAILQLLFIGIHVIFAPYTFVLLPFLTIWYFIFLGQFLLYDALNYELSIEEKFSN